MNRNFISKITYLFFNNLVSEWHINNMLEYGLLDPKIMRCGTYGVIS